MVQLCLLVEMFPVQNNLKRKVSCLLCKHVFTHSSKAICIQL